MYVFFVRAINENEFINHLRVLWALIWVKQKNQMDENVFCVFNLYSLNDIV